MGWTRKSTATRRHLGQNDLWGAAGRTPSLHTEPDHLYYPFSSILSPMTGRHREKSGASQDLLQAEDICPPNTLMLPAFWD